LHGTIDQEIQEDKMHLQSRLCPVLVTALITLLAACSTTSDKDADRRWDPQQDARLASPESGPLKNPFLPFPVGQKLFVDSPPAETSGTPCADNSFLLHELSVSNIGLSYRDVAGSTALLRTMGYPVLDTSAGSTLAFACENLPVLVQPGAPEELQMTHDAGVNATGNAVTGDLTVRALRPSNTVDTDHLLVFYHPEQAAEIERLQALVRNVIDVPSPQVYIETLVLEVSEEDSKELGISYENANIGSNSLLNLGALEVDNDGTAGFTRSTRTEDGINIFTPGGGIELQIRALVDEGRAEVLSRPSVLALSNRQAVIQIVDVVQTPILESTITQSGEVVISSYQFEPLLLGITLNLRPRVSEDRQWISLEIDATVEAEVDENSGTAFAPDAEGGRVALAEKKGSASRKVRTFARIPDRTPIIIGGLVAGNREEAKSRVPVLGRIPFFGALFGATDNEVQKREVIIVLTPHVLAEDAIGVASNRPRDDVMARVSDLMLFNNSYRVRTEDVFNMNFLLEDPLFSAYRDRALALIEKEPALGSGHPAYRFHNGRIPGEQALVAKMLFDIISSSANRVSPNKDQIFLPELSAGQSIRYTALSDLVEEAGLGETNNRGLWLEFLQDEPRGLVRHQLIERGSNESWADIESRLTRGMPVQSSGVLIRSQSDLEHLVRAIAVDTVLRLNGGYPVLTVQSLAPGTVLKLGTPADYTNYKLSVRTAQIYEYTNRYFDILQQELARTYRALDTVEKSRELL
jgi:general secretion pathway protein D